MITTSHRFLAIWPRLMHLGNTTMRTKNAKGEAMLQKQSGGRQQRASGSARRRPRYVDPAQLEMVFTFRSETYRAAVLQAVNASPAWRSAREIATAAGLTYPQTVFALYALHNNEQIARIGRKFTARWGSLKLVKAPPTNYNLLQELFNGIVKR